MGCILELPALPIKIDLSWRTLFAAALLIFIVFGLATKLYFSVQLDFNSDMAGEGLQAMEIWKHNNYLLSGYYLPADDTFIFTELLPFQLIPQILTNYDPLTLKVVSFIVFGLAIASLSYVVFIVSGETVNALLFAALAVNLSPAGYDFFAIPTTHIATIVFLGAMFILLLHMGKMDEALREKAGKRKKKRAIPANIKWPLVMAIGALALLSALSDTIIFIWFIIPFVLAYLLFYRQKTPGLNIAVASMASASVLAYVFKTNFVREWVSQSFVNLDTSRILSVTLPLSFKSLAVFLDTGLYRALDGHALWILEAASIITLIALVLYALKNAIDDKKRRFFYGVLLLSGAIMFASFLAMGLVKDMSQARYFTFTALTVFMLVAVSYRKDNRIYGALALVFLLLAAAYGLSYARADWGHQPNAQDLGLIVFLKENNLTYGYGSYFVSNTLTYLSGEDVTIRPVLFYRDGLKPNVWLECERWYWSVPEKAFILVDNSTIDDNSRQVIRSLTKSLNASEPLHYGKYDIYPTNSRAFKTSGVSPPS